ncbi:MAG: tetratricopeptide repeat protein [Blastocatellia bacterium]
MKKSIPVTILLVGLGLLYPMQRHIDEAVPQEIISDEMLYLSGDTVKRLSLGMEGLAADVYWIRTVQYFGGKLMESDQPLSSSASTNLRMDLLAPLLNIVVTLDPHHIPAYRFGAIFLPERDLPAAIALLEKGIQENSNEWRLYQDLGYIYWQAGNRASGDERAADYAKAGDWYERGGKVAGAMWWMRDLAGYMKIAGGSREAAYAIYSSYLNSDDENIRNQAATRLKQLRALDEIDAINKLLARYKSQTGQCVTDLRQLAPQWRAMKLTLNDEQRPVDPDGVAYELKPEACKVQLAWESKIPQ